MCYVADDLKALCGGSVELLVLSLPGFLDGMFDSAHSVDFFNLPCVKLQHVEPFFKEKLPFTE